MLCLSAHTEFLLIDKIWCDFIVWNTRSQHAVFKWQFSSMGNELRLAMTDLLYLCLADKLLFPVLRVCRWFDDSITNEVQGFLHSNNNYYSKLLIIISLIVGRMYQSVFYYEFRRPMNRRLWFLFLLDDSELKFLKAMQHTHNFQRKVKHGQFYAKHEPICQYFIVFVIY